MSTTAIIRHTAHDSTALALRLFSSKLTSLFALAALMIGLSVTHAQADDASKAYVKDLGEAAIAILSDKELDAAQTEDKFRTLLLSALDIRRVGLFALGQYARLPTPEQKETYFDLLGEFIVKVYLGRLTGYSDQQFLVLDSVEKGNKGREVIVDSKITFAEGNEPLRVEWWLIRDKDGSFRVFDVNVAGIWMAQEQRGAFSSQIRNNGGSFEALLDHLRKQAGTRAGQNTQTTTTEPVPQTTATEDVTQDADDAS
ncbi:ABC transporter substrate-binding protein [Pyruvatibacter sp.]|uniref:MlaC/ttg2D family ABC transporter substrate-binding protein n=1 Tax=Pyruvatibacter sp. TaxID=1981328 RepID=UPI0032ECA2DB